MAIKGFIRSTCVLLGMAILRPGIPSCQTGRDATCCVRDSMSLRVKARNDTFLSYCPFLRSNEYSLQKATVICKNCKEGRRGHPNQGTPSVPSFSIHGGVYAKGGPYRREDRDQRLDDHSPNTLLICHTHTVLKVK